MASYFQGFEDEHKPEMTDNIEDFQFAKFAKEKFQADESHYSSRDVLKHPLLPLKDRKHQRMALRIWVVLLRLMVWLQEPRYLALMAEYKAIHVDNLVTDPPMSDIQMIQYIIMCGIDIPNLRDEIYCQLCKQLTKNSNNQSKLKVWELLCLCVGCFPPSGNLVNYLRNFIKGRPSDYAPYCEQKLKTTIKKCSRLYPPSSLEIQATKTKKPLMLPVKFQDGTTIMVSVDSATTARELCLHIAEKISLVDQFGFFLNLEYCNGDENLVRLTAKQNVNDPKVKEDIVSYARNKLATSFSLFWGVSKVAGPGLQKDTADIAVNFTGLYVVDRQTDVNKWNGKYFIKLSFPEKLSILSNRTDDMPWYNAIVTIQTVKGDQYTFTAWSTRAEEIKYVVEAIQTPPSKQDHSQAAPNDSDDVNIAGMSRMKITAGDVIQAQRGPTNWQKGQLLGIGGFGKVYKCHDKDTGQEYAVKMVKLGIPNAKIFKEVRALENEINLLRDLQHDKIVQYFGFKNDGEVFSIFIEFMPGGSVKQLIDDTEGDLQESVVRKYSQQIVLGLAYLHTKRIVHRDIKAANVLRDNYANIKLADFGVSKRLLTICSETKSFVGSPYWMAPEVIKSEEYGRKADIWSFGCTVVEMLSSNPPFHKYEPVAAIFKIGQCKPPEYELPETVTRLAKDFLALTLQNIPADRWSAEKLVKHKFIQDET